jgi:hypothetical protein
MMRITRLIGPGLNPVTIRNAIANASDLARRKRRHRSCYNRSRQNNLPKHIHNHEVNIIKKESKASLLQTIDCKMNGFTKISCFSELTLLNSCQLAFAH